MSHTDYNFVLADPLFAFNEEGVPTQTSFEQKKVEQRVAHEDSVLNHMPNFLDEQAPAKFVLRREAHVQYILRCLNSLPEEYVSMDASRPWFCFWGMHSLRLLGHRPDKELLNRIIKFLKCCEAPNGGYGGGPGQKPHLATTYAAVMALVSVGTKEALDSIDCAKLRYFFESVRRKDGSFLMHQDGEADMRGVYCAIACSYITGIVDAELFADTSAWIMRCQSYEGGFGGEPNCEAHGGYTFCAVASLALLQKSHLLNVNRVIYWLVNRQMPFEGGFNGRTNKLVDGCYSFWQAATFFTLEYESSKSLKQHIRGLFDEKALESYILVISQGGKDGGLRDKPNKLPDLYHTCYVLSGLSVAQSYAKSSNEILGGEANCLADVHPLYNLCVTQETFAKEYFSNF